MIRTESGCPPSVFCRLLSFSFILPRFYKGFISATGANKSTTISTIFAIPLFYLPPYPTRKRGAADIQVIHQILPDFITFMTFCMEFRFWEFHTNVWNSIQMYGILGLRFREFHTFHEMHGIQTNSCGHPVATSAHKMRRRRVAPPPQYHNLWYGVTYNL